jgi:hypothetical protein
MADKDEDEIVLTRSTRDGVEKLDFYREGKRWRVVLVRPGSPVRKRPPERVKKYSGVDDAWKDVETYTKEGYKIALYEV